MSERVGHCRGLVYCIIINSVPSVDGRVSISTSSLKPTGQLSGITTVVGFLYISLEIREFIVDKVS
jgi:hypothetical protein